MTRPVPGHGKRLVWLVVKEGPGEGNGAFLLAQMVKNLPAVWETQVRFLGWEDPLKKEMTPHFSILAWRILWSEEPGNHVVAKSWTRLSN